VNGDTLGTESLAVARNPNDVGIVATARIAKCGNLVDIYA
jgi:hypothetical protein